MIASSEKTLLLELGMCRKDICDLVILRRVILKRVFVTHSKNCPILQSNNPNHPDQELPIDERENLVINQAKL